MYFIEERIQRFMKDIGQLIYIDSEVIREFQVRDGNISKDVEVDLIKDGWKDYTCGTSWCKGNVEQYTLFKTRIEIPERFDNKHVVLGIQNDKEEWNASNLQILVYINGKETQALDRNHQEIFLSDNAEKGKIYDITLHAFNRLKYGGTDYKDIKLFAYLKVIDPLIEDFYYNVGVPLQAASQLPEGSIEKIKLMDVLNKTINKVDLRIAYSEEFYFTLKEANEYIKENLYSKLSMPDEMLTCIGHTHIDVAWLWRYCHTREKVVRSFTTVLSLMEQYPEYLFMSSQPQLYQFLKEDHPKVYEEIKERVKEGRWEPEGGMWVESDTNVPSGESLVRQFLYGKRFFKQEFDADNKILWLPDVFGYSGALPQIMKKSGIDYFMTSKLKHNQYNEFPYNTFMWKGIDGTEVLSHISSYNPNTYNGLADQGDIIKAWNDFKEKEINTDALFTYGYGDGGGGPTKEMLETIRRYDKGLPGCPAAKPGRAIDYFDRLDKKVQQNKRLPKWDGELYFEHHRGTYTSMARNKKKNRKAEFLYTSAEWISSLNGLLFGSDYQAQKLEKGWKNILLNQFHDVLPGSSIKEVYEDSDVIYEEVFKDGEEILEEGLYGIISAINTDEEKLVVFNMLSNRTEGIVEFCNSSDKEEIYLMYQDGTYYSCQKIEEEENRFVAYVTDVSSKGYSTYQIKEEKESLDTQVSEISITTDRLENKYYRILLDEKGNFTSVFDKRENRELLKQGERGNVLQAFEDKPRNEDNWNIDIYYTEKMWEINDVERIEVVENGPVRGIIRIERKFLNSTITQDIIMYNDIPRIDFKTVADWKEKDIIVKAAFPVDLNANQATYEIQFGNIVRNTHWNTSWDMAKFEVCGHKWADLSEEGYGISLLNDCKYGYDIKDGNMRITLLRSGTIPNPDADKEIHEFTYSLYPHQGNWREAQTLVQAYDLNCPLIGKVINNQKGSLPQNLSMMNVDKENVIVEAVKKAEDSDDTIIRVYEAYNKRTNATIKLPKTIKQVIGCNLMENELKQENDEVRCKDDEFTFTIKPFEIKTFKIRWND